MLPAMRGRAIAIIVAVTRIAFAEPGAAPDPRAATIFQQARDLGKAGKLDEACALFAQSYALDPALGTAMNLADCFERQGQPRRAWELFDTVARGSQNVQSRARLARQRADALLAQLATVVITVRDAAAPGLAIRIGERVVAPAAEVRLVVEPADVEVVATRPGAPAWRTRLHAEAGQILTVVVPALVAPPPRTRRRRSRLFVAAGLGVTGAAVLGASVGLGISAKQRYDSAFDGGGCVRGEPARCTLAGKATVDRAGDRADLATGLAIGGAVLVGLGTALFLTAPHDAIRIEPIATSHALGVGVLGRF